MDYTRELTIEVNGKTINATVSVSAPGLDAADCLDFQMILAAAANGQRMEYHSRHHKNRVAVVDARPKQANQDTQATKPTLRLVA